MLQTKKACLSREAQTGYRLHLSMHQQPFSYLAGIAFVAKICRLLGTKADGSTKGAGGIGAASLASPASSDAGASPGASSPPASQPASQPVSHPVSHPQPKIGRFSLRIGQHPPPQLLILLNNPRPQPQLAASQPQLGSASQPQLGSVSHPQLGASSQSASSQPQPQLFKQGKLSFNRLQQPLPSNPPRT